jgi:aspartyl-tRNA(Asn)/glutamyl-tRNA(Gln) amidotransferase subunit A
MAQELEFMSIAEAARLIEARKLSPVEYTDALLGRVETFEPQLNAFITVTADLARKQARQAEAEIMAGRYRGPLHGITFALKDTYNTKGILTSGGSKIGLDNIPASDATTTRLLGDAGAILLGKLQTHEFAHGGPAFDLPWPPARNPWHLEHFTGGSSSGSGGAVAGGMVPAALGSDTGGSIRGPASYCGIVGLKATTGLVSRAGTIPHSFTFDHCGPMTRTVDDCAILLQAIAGYDPLDAGSIAAEIPNYRGALSGDIKGLRIGVARHYWETDVPSHSDVGRAMDEAIAVFKRLGAKVEDCRMRPLLDLFDIRVTISESEIYSVHYDNLKVRAGDYCRDFLGGILPGCLIRSADYMQATREHRRVISDMQPLYERYDVLLIAGFGPAPRLDEYRTINKWLKPNIHSPASVTGGPSLEVPNGFSNGLPLGMQIVGRPFDDTTVLRVGHAYEQATDWHTRRPPLIAGTPQPKLIPKGNEPVPANLDAATRDYILQSASRAGLKLNDFETAILLETGPYALEMSERVRRPRDRHEEPTLVFRFPPTGM